MQKVVESLLQAGNGEKAMEILEKSRLPMIDAGEHEVVGKLLNELAASMPGVVEPLEWLVELYGRTSDSFHMADALAHLGDALVTDQQYDRAKTIFEQLVDREPESDSAKRKLNHVLRKLGLVEGGELEELPQENLQAEIPKAPAAKLRADEEETPRGVPSTPAVTSTEPALDDETQKFIAQSLTDVDLFASYGLTQKAIGLLEAILRRAPRHTPTLEKLLDFVLGAGDDRRTAELAAQLEQIHSETGDKRSSERFGELRRRFQRAAGLTDEELAIAVPPAKSAAPPIAEPEPMDAPIPEIAAELAPPEPAPVPEPVRAAPVEEAPPAPVEEIAAPAQAEVQEVDLSDEWATLIEETRPSEPVMEAPAPVAAKPAGAPAPHTKPGDVEEFQIGEEPAIVPADNVPAVTSFELADAAPTIPLKPEPIQEKAGKKPAPPKPKEVPAAKAPPPPPAPEPEFELEQEYELVLEQEPLVPAYDQRPPETPVAPPAPEPVARNAAPAPPSGSGFASDQFLADLANEIDQLGIGELAPGFSGSMPNARPPSATKAPAAPAAPAGESGPLKEVFDEFRAELGEMGAEEEDLETHYNLGIAFREMGLLEEAISEFQKVAKASDRGRPFRYTMQCCTLLGLAFMEKGQPAIAAIWYERALQTPGNDPESTLALRYDLGVAQESAGEPEAALKSFSQVYAMNIDYRGVAERIAALQKPAR
jgi:tetratricopeptide (TPR) repeat protein